MIMKTKLIILFLFSVSLVYSQSVEVTSKERLAVGEAAYHVVFNSQGTQILYSSDNYKGLTLFDLSTKAKTVLTDVAGAGYNPIFSGDESNVIFKQSSYTQDGYKLDELIEMNLGTLKRVQLVEPSRNLKSPLALESGVAIVKNKNLLKTDNQKENVAYVCIEDNKIALYKNGSREELAPFDEDVIGYIWPSISPDATKLLFTAVGKGTFVSDLKGNILESLGVLSSPKWYTDNFVVGMQNESDGTNYISSKVLIVSSDGNYKKVLTPTTEIAMYPSVSAVSNRIAYNTLDGDVYVLTVDINEK